MNLEELAALYGGLYKDRPPTLIKGTKAKPLYRVADFNTPYVWGSEINGEATANQGLVPVSMDVPAGLISAIDTSSAQPRDLSGLVATYHPEHVIVKLYQSIETIPQSYSVDQAQSAIDAGCTVGGYVWLYRDVDVNRQINDAVKLYGIAGCQGPLWVDVETYTDGSIPTEQQVMDALSLIELAGLVGGIYSSREMWRRIGNPTWAPHNPAWVADYNEKADLDVQGFGGLTVSAEGTVARVSKGAVVRHR